MQFVPLVLSRRQYAQHREDIFLSAGDEAKIIIQICKMAEFDRTYDSVVMQVPLMRITPEPLDDLLLWVARFKPATDCY